MKSVADELRHEQIARMLGMSAAERMQLSRTLGEEAALVYANARGISVDEARRALQRQRQVGRRASACHTALLA